MHRSPVHRFCEEDPLGEGDCEKDTQTGGSTCGKEGQEVGKKEEIGGFEKQEVECEGEGEGTTMLCISPPACQQHDRKLTRSTSNNLHDRKFARPRDKARVHLSSLAGVTWTTGSGQPVPADIPSMELSKHYLSLGSSSKVAGPRPSLNLHPQRQTSRSDLPLERLRFFETLKLLLMLNKRKEKEPGTPGRLGALGVGGPTSAISLQHQQQQQLWQNPWNDLIWLELQAWHAGRSTSDQDMYLYAARKTVPDVMSDVLAFRFCATTEGEVTSPMLICDSLSAVSGEPYGGTTQDAGSGALFSAESWVRPARDSGVRLGARGGVQRDAESEVYLSGGSEAWPSGDSGMQQIKVGGVQSGIESKPLHARGTTKGEDLKSQASSSQVHYPRGFHLIDPAHLERQREACQKVKALLEALDAVEALYPSLHALQHEHPAYGAKTFQHRLHTLCLWLNTTKDLNHKLGLMGTILGVREMAGAGWPVFEVTSPLWATGGANHGDAGSSLSSSESEKDTGEDLEDVEEEEEIELNCEDEKDGLVRRVSGKIHEDPAILTAERASARVHFQDVFFGSESDGDEIHGDILGPVDLEQHHRCPPALYRPFVDKALKQMGLRKLTMRLRKLLDGSLQRARTALLADLHTAQIATQGDLKAQDLLPELLEQLSLGEPQHGRSVGPDDVPEADLTERVSPAEMEELGLPSFRPAYLVLCRILLNVIHDCLRLRLEQRPAGEPSLLSVKQLVRECKEVLKGGLIVKQYYQYMTEVVLTTTGGALSPDSNIEEFEADLQNMLMVYFEYVQSWIRMLQRLPQASHGLKNLLEQEWDFSKQVVPFVRGGEARAGRLFCDIARCLLESTGEFLRDGVKQLCSEPFASPDDSIQSDGLRRSVMEICRAVRELFHEARERASKALGFAKMLCKDLGIAAEFEVTAPPEQLKSALQESQHVKVRIEELDRVHMFAPAAVAEQYQRLVRLVSAACGRDISYLAREGEQLPGYLLLLRPGDPLGGLRHQGANLRSPEEQSVPRLRVEDFTEPIPVPEEGERTETGVSGRGWEQWNGESIRLSLPGEMLTTLQDLQASRLLMVAQPSSLLHEQRKVFQRLTRQKTRLICEQTSTQPAIAYALHSLKTEALALCEGVAMAIGAVEERFEREAEGDLEEIENYSMQQCFKETMIQSFNFGFEYHKDVVRLVSGEARQRVGEHFISFARRWMVYVLKNCESGRGTRPRWATHGFEFITAIEPAFISALPEEEFVSLQTLINNCILHVIGKPHSPGVGIHRNSPRPVKVPRCHSDPPVFSVSVPITPALEPPRVQSLSDGDRVLTSDLHFRSRHSSPTDDNEDLTFGQSDSLPSGSLPSLSTPNCRSWELLTTVSQAREEIRRNNHMTRVRRAVQRFQHDQDLKLRSRQVIGRVCDNPQSAPSTMHVGLRKVTFKWQRGNKIGEGQYGKVYTCVNVDTGELMAMKEIRFQPNDHKTIKETADEIKIFEGIQHPNLVRYYGVELHREEMYIFMEYCDEGTLEEVARLGLQEPVIRLYTKQLALAVSILHENGIVHRDIKGANIFLTSSGHVKLGDFGCSVKLKNISQTMPGEVNSTLGTAAYMAPEVITRARGEGHGRAADIWSLGCVLVEIATGKRPWCEYEHNFQIMYRVGMGHKPPTPERLGPEGRAFLARCFEGDPRARPTASQLLDHPFLKVCLDPDED
uniref:mitogen-activated protein kinase kinase kinase 4 n=1 Tax=Myxine glutinosa TaxID=7769 RepID=UPI00358DF201